MCARAANLQRVMLGYRVWGVRGEKGRDGLRGADEHVRLKTRQPNFEFDSSPAKPFFTGSSTNPRSFPSPHRNKASYIAMPLAVSCSPGLRLVSGFQYSPRLEGAKYIRG